MKAFLKFNFTDDGSITLEIEKFVKINSTENKGIFHVDKMRNGKYRLIVDSRYFSDNDKLLSMEVIKKD